MTDSRGAKPHRCQRCGLWAPHKFGLHRPATSKDATGVAGFCTGKVRPVRV